MKNFDEIKNKIKGPAFAIITPFLESSSDIDYDCLSKYIQYLYDEGAKVFYVMAYNSRFSVLTDREIFDLNEFVIKKVNSFNDYDTVCIAADPLHCSTKSSLEFALRAEEAGADCISLIFREKVYFEEQIFNHFKYISDNSSIGILIHEMPLNNGIPGEPALINWSLTLLDRLADINNVIALKEDTKDKQYTKEICDTIASRVAIITSGMGMRQWIENAPICSSYLSGIGGIKPKIELDFYKAFMEDNIDSCNKIIENIEIPFDQIKKFGWHLGFKSALEVAGIMSRTERMPLEAIGDTSQNEVKKIMISIAKSNTEYFNSNEYD